jgi:hypothetical protein
VIEAFTYHDLAALRALPPQQRSAQLAARNALYQHARAIWEQAKSAGLDPATRPEWQPVARMCDLTHVLRATAASAIVTTSTTSAGSQLAGRPSVQL